MTGTERPKVGVGILLVKNGQVLLGRRKSSHGAGEYALPGGHLELGESFEDCVLRELAEEAGSDIQVKHPKYLCTTNLRRYAPKHYVDIGMLAEWVSGEPRVMEPDKIDDWQWYDMNAIPEPVFAGLHNYLEAYRTSRRYFTE